MSRKKVIFIVLEVLINRSEGDAEVPDIEEFEPFVSTKEPDNVEPCNGKHSTTFFNFVYNISTKA